MKLNEMNKGCEICRVDEWGDDTDRGRSSKRSPYIFFLTIPFITIFSYIVEPKIDLILTFQLPMSSIMAFITFLVFEMSITMDGSPVIVYSNGIEHNGGHLSRILGKPDFTPRPSIKVVEVSEHRFTNAKSGASSSYAKIVIRTTNGRRKEIERQTDKMRGFKASMGKIGVPLIDRGAVLNFVPIDPDEKD